MDYVLLSLDLEVEIVYKVFYIVEWNKIVSLLEYFVIEKVY